ncbi:MAG: hypothetical protein IKD96_04680 [Oscillospiraceae bacterium]|nr:hypothetical protein [Oscillospiraceae bacterium]
MESKRFRSSFLGGFNRDDVLHYIEDASRTCQERSETDQQEIRALREEKTALQGEIDGLRRQIAEMEEQMAALKAANDELESVKQERDALREQLSEANAKNEELEPLSKKYQAIQSRLTGIELDAHTRAAAIEAAACGHADQLKGDLLAAVLEAQQAYDDTWVKSDSAYAKFRQELQDVTGVFERLGTYFSAVSDRLQDVRAAAMEPPLTPGQPLPGEVPGE